MKLNLGCGAEMKYGDDWINFDISPPADVIGDLEEPLPLENESLDYVWASHILEHISNFDQLKLELARIMKPDGVLEIVVPSYASADAWGDPSHVRGFSPLSFEPCWWPGFALSRLERERHVKKFLNLPVLWLHVEMIRTKQQLWQVKRAPVMGGKRGGGLSFDEMENEEVSRERLLKPQSGVEHGSDGGGSNASGEEGGN